MSYAEEAMGSQAMRLLGVRHKESLALRDVVQLVRGYEKSKNRAPDTSAAMRKIALWREEVGFQRILQTTLDRRTSAFVCEKDAYVLGGGGEGHTLHSFALRHPSSRTDHHHTLTL
jgi:hypothetical protein